MDGGWAKLASVEGYRTTPRATSGGSKGRAALRPAGRSVACCWMRARMRGVRERLAAADKAVPGLNLAAIGQGHGLFAMLPLGKDRIEALRRDHGAASPISPRRRSPTRTSAACVPFRLVSSAATAPRGAKLGRAQCT